ncbi:MAG: Holliday junction branch migration DNA helicase RuvB [Parachlamydiales bacterium]|jgi:Holliday junction DNA helicase RuvB
MAEHFIESALSKPDTFFENNLRPGHLNEFFGQEKIQDQLAILIGAAKKRKEPISHLLFFGPPGLGKTTLASLVAKTMGTNLTSTSGPILEKPADLAGLLTNLNEGDILFIDEIHRLNPVIEEYLYPAMEDFKLDLMIDSGPSARSVQVNLNRFTLIGATTRSGLLSAPMRSRFGFSARLDYYPKEVLQKILFRSAEILGAPIDPKAALLIAERSRGTPRIANNLLRWVRDFSQMNNAEKIVPSLAKAALEALLIDEKGLDEMDKKMLSVIIDHHGGGPVGIETLAIALGEESATLSEVYEPYLIQMGFLKRTKRGREATPSAYAHMGKNYTKNGEEK